MSFREIVDVFAVPFFALLIFYLMMQPPSFINFILIIFAIVGLIVDASLSYEYLSKIKN